MSRIIMKIRYPMHIEEELTDINELIELSEELIDKEGADDALTYNLNFLQSFKKELTDELNLSYKRYMLNSFDTTVESGVEGKIPSIAEATRYLLNLQETLYSLAESALGKVVKGSKISDVVFEGATMGIGNAKKGSLKIQLKQINNSQTTFHPYLKIATDKLNEILDCGSDEYLLREQAAKLGSQPIYKYKNLLNGIKNDNITVTLFDKIKPEGYETQTITPEFAGNVYSAIIQAEPNEDTYFEEIEGELIVINGKNNTITISSKDEEGNDKDYHIDFDNERFSSLVGGRYKKKVKVKIKTTENYYELEEDTKIDRELKKFL